MLPNRDNPMERLELLTQYGFASPRDAIGAAALLGGERLDPAASLETCQGGIERTGFKLRSAELGNIFHHGIAMLGTVRQAGQDQERRVREAPQVKLLFVHRRFSPWFYFFTLHSINYYVSHSIMDEDGCQGLVFCVYEVYCCEAHHGHTEIRGSMIVNTERDVGAGKSNFPLTRVDVERLRSKVEHAAQLDLHLQNLQQIDLSYMDLQGANLQGADLQAATLRGTNLSGANLRGANLSEADLDGADLSRAHLGDTEKNRVKLYHAKLSYATLRELDLRGFDLTELDLRNADLNGTDLRGAVLRGADLQGADLSTAHLNGPELQGAILHHGAFPGDRGEQKGREKATKQGFSQYLEGALKMTKIKIGLVGLGEVAQIIHLPILQTYEDKFEIAAICDISQELLSALGERYHVPVEHRYLDAQELAKQGDLDAIFVLNSDEYHTDATLAALNIVSMSLLRNPCA